MQKIRVVIAAGEPVFCEGLRWILAQQEDMEIVGIACTGENSVDVIGELKPHVGVVELGLPGVNGVALIKELKRVSPVTGILGLTRKPSVPCILASVEAGLAGYLLKRSAPEEIITAIRGIYNGEAVMDLSTLKKLNNAQSSAFGFPNSDDGNGWLSFRELQVLKLASKGLTTKEIAKTISLSDRTVQAHLATIFRKFDVGSRTEAVVHALKTGWLGPEDL
jgi:DNA-binding NarL/FixJ family response regulator